MEGDRLPRVPGRASVSQLLTAGLLEEDQVRADGTVDEDVRSRAEAQYVASGPVSRPRRRPCSARTVRETCSARTVRETDRLKCCVCLQAERQYAFVPCYHLCVCEGCMARLSVCPLCRVPLQYARRIWL